VGLAGSGTSEQTCQLLGGQIWVFYAVFPLHTYFAPSSALGIQLKYITPQGASTPSLASARTASIALGRLWFRGQALHRRRASRLAPAAAGSSSSSSCWWPVTPVLPKAGSLARRRQTGGGRGANWGFSTALTW
jgi:hypothetical protein